MPSSSFEVHSDVTGELEPTAGMPSLTFFSQPLVIPAFLAGILLSGAIAAWARSLKLRGRLCPECASTTVALVPGFPLRLLGGSLVKRWCAGCGWKGLASQPAHERRGRGGKVRLNGSFKWGGTPPPPDGYFNWGGEEAEAQELISRLEEMEPEGPELSLPGFQWRDHPRSPEGGGFNWAQGGGPPPIPFQFAGEEVQPPPRGILPKLGFRWRG
jgi:hypothetical protein